MGKLTKKQLEELKEAGIIDESAEQYLKSNEMVSSGKGRSKFRRVMLNGAGDKVEPRFYLKGAGPKEAVTDEMKALREEVKAVIERFTEEDSETEVATEE